MKKIFIFLLCVASIPLTSGLMLNYIIADNTAVINRELKSQDFSWDDFCEQEIWTQEDLESESSRDFVAAAESDCADHKMLSTFSSAAWITLTVSLLVPIIFWLVAAIAGTRREVLASIFPWMVRFSLVVVAASTAAQGILFGALLYFGESHLVGRVHIGIVGLAALGGLSAAYLIVSQALSLARGSPVFVIGKTLGTDDRTGIRQLVESVAVKLGAKTPANIVVGLEPNFFVTSANVSVFGEPTVLSGDTIYLSTVLVRLFSPAETRAVIGHELGHFIGEDTKYSKKFAPMYRQLQKSIDSISDFEGASSIATIPATVTLSVMLEMFAKNERTIGRSREFEADRHGAEAGSSDAVISALIKAVMVAPSYAEILRYNLEKLSNGEVLNNLSNIIQFASSERCRELSSSDVAANVGSSVSSHPIDTHPTLSERAKALGVDLSRACDAAIEDLKAHNSSELAEDALAEIETAISMCEHRYAVATKQVVLPRDVDEGSDSQASA